MLYQIGMWNWGQIFFLQSGTVASKVLVMNVYTNPSPIIYADICFCLEKQTSDGHLWELEESDAK